MKYAKSILLSLSLGLAAFTAAAAAPKETVTMRNGTVYMGATSAKDFNNNSFTFLVDSAYIVTDIDKIDFTAEQRMLSRLKAKWQDWFYAHPELIKRNASGEEVVNMYVAHLRDSGRAAEDIVILERTPSQIKYVSLEMNNIPISNSEVVSVDYAPRAAGTISGILDKIVTSNATYSGQIVREDVNYTGILTDENIVEMIPVNDIIRREIHPLLVSQPIAEQVEFFDNVVTDDRTYTGIITSIVFRPAENGAEPYYTVNLLDDLEATKVPFNKVSSITRRSNADGYKPVTDSPISSPDSIYASGVLLKSREITTTTEKGQVYRGFEENVAPTVVKATNGVIELLFKDAPANQVIMIMPVSWNTSNVKFNNKPLLYSFTDTQMMNMSHTPVKRDTTPLGNVKQQYAVTLGTNYIIYRQSDRSYYLISVE